ncbi:MAG TPA: 3-hydroxyacyl-CoA dehydrogenase family protein, partial [Candidatus Obscuribacterales bacterium]
AAFLNLTEPLSPDIVSPLRRIFAPPVQALPAQAVVAEVKKKAKGYGAPGRAAGIVLKTLVMPLDKALEYESAEFANLSQSRESRNLVSIFLDRSSAKKLNGDAVGLKVESLAIIGSGIMGREIAFEALYADEIDQVVLIDVKEEFLAKARAHMEELMASRVRSGKIAELNAKAKFNKLTTSTDYGAIVDCDAVIEAVPETYAMKSQCYEQIDHAMSGRTKTTPYFIFSNTSALSLTRLSQSVRFPANFSGLHFFNPVSQMAGVEIPTAQGTSDETLSTAIRLVGALGKIPLPCREHPGFIVNAILGAELVVTDHLLSMGVAPSVIDKAMLTFGMPMGPVELMDYVGLDVVLSVAKTLREVHGDRLALPADDVVARLVERGYLGRKSGQGFYLWKGERTERDEKTRLPVLNPALAELLPGPGNMNMASEAVQELLVGAIESEAVRVLEAGVVAHPFLIDLAFVVSTGFTASLGGPIRHIDQRGVKTFYDLMSDIADGAELPAQGWRRNFVPPALLAEHARERTNLYGP